jgi:hypothetical protein
VTIVSMLSVKGSPGVTTLACLVASAWPGPGAVTVVEADPAGGDLAARFGLSSRTGWPSLSSSTRRSGDAPSVAPHLQELPGGLPVLVGARGCDRRTADSPEGEVLRSARPGSGSPGLTLVDLGRLAEGDRGSEGWMGVSDASIVVVRGDASSVVQVRERASGLLAGSDGRLGIVVIGGGPYGGREVSEFTGITCLGEVPFDPAAAHVASGASGAAHRLDRSLLWLAAGRLAAGVASRIEDGWSSPPGPGGTDASPVDEVSRRTWLPRGRGPTGRDRAGRRGRARVGDGEAPHQHGTAEGRVPFASEAYAEVPGRTDR